MEKQLKILHPLFFKEFKTIWDRRWNTQQILLEFNEYLKIKGISDAQREGLSETYVLKSLGVV